MTTKLEAPLRREVAIGDDRYTLTITATGLSLVPKGKRKGWTLEWQAFIDGEAALAVALNASLARAPAQTKTSQAAKQDARSPAIVPATAAAEKKATKKRRI